MRVSMRSSFTIAILIVTLAMSAFSLGTTGPVLGQGSQPGKRYILLGANESLPMGLEAMVAAAGGRIVDTVPEVGLAVVESDEPSFEFAAAGISGVEAVAADEEVYIGGLASDVVAESDAPGSGIVAEGHNPQLARFFFVQWAMKAVNADDAWAEGFRGSPSVDVAVLDTGIDYTHQELMGKVDLVRSTSFYYEPLSPLPPGLPAGTPVLPILDFNGHGTFVASMIAAQGISVAGVAPHVNLIAVKVGGRNGFAPWSAIILAIRYAADSGADVINMSFGARMTKDELKADHLKRAISRAIKYAERRGAFLASSAGNEATDWTLDHSLTKIPAGLREVNAVSATGPANFVDFNSYTPYTDYGFNFVGFAAPGGNATPFRCLPIFAPMNGPMIACNPLAPLPNGNPNPAGMPADAIIGACSRFVQFLPGNGMAFPCRTGRTNVFNFGTSMASAIVSGVAALADGVANGQLTGDELRHILRKSSFDLGRPGRDEYYGYGLVNALDAARCVQQRLNIRNGKIKGKCE